MILPSCKIEDTAVMLMLGVNAKRYMQHINGLFGKTVDCGF